MKRNGCHAHLGPSEDPFEGSEGFGDHPADLARDVDIPHFSFFVALFLFLV